MTPYPNPKPNRVHVCVTYLEIGNLLMSLRRSSIDYEVSCIPVRFCICIFHGKHRMLSVVVPVLHTLTKKPPQSTIVFTKCVHQHCDLSCSFLVVTASHCLS